MKTIKLFALAFIAIVLFNAASMGDCSSSGKPPLKEPNTSGFAVIELFTSEGCSSCPAADELMEQLHRESSDKPVYILSYHVDYWNHLGWKDIFSDPAYTKRQRQYAAWLNEHQLYTPQAILNGKKALIGSNEKALRDAKGIAFNSPSTAKLSIRKGERRGLFNYDASGNLNDSRLLIAVIQKHATRNIQRGENNGLTLHHTHIVRALHSFEIDAGGTINVELPDKFEDAEWEIIGMVQNVKNGEIKAATRI